MILKISSSCRLAATAAVVLGGLCQLSSAAANDADLLQLLEKKGYLTAAEVGELKASRALEQEAEEKRTAFVVTAPTNKNVLSLKINGRFQFQYDGISASIDNNGTTTSLAGSNKADFRRLFLGVEAELRNNWYAKGLFNFAGNSTVNGGLVDQVLIGWKPEKDIEVRVGYEKVPFSYGTTVSSARLLAIENDPGSNYFARTLGFNNYHSGASILGKPGAGFEYHLMLANGGQGFGVSGNGYSVWGRVRHTSEFEDYNAKLMLGADVGYQSENTSGSAWLKNAAITGYSLYARADIGDLLLIGEFIGSSVEGVGGGARSNPYGVNGTVAYSIGDIQPVFQYSYINSGKFAGGINPSDVIRAAPTDASLGSIAGPHSLNAFFLGANYYIMGNDLRLSAGAIYVTAPANNGADGNNTSYEAIGGRAQIQVIF